MSLSAHLISDQRVCKFHLFNRIIVFSRYLRHGKIGIILRLRFRFPFFPVSPKRGLSAKTFLLCGIEGFLINDGRITLAAEIFFILQDVLYSAVLERQSRGFRCRLIGTAEQIDCVHGFYKIRIFLIYNDFPINNFISQRCVLHLNSSFPGKRGRISWQIPLLFC